MKIYSFFPIKNKVSISPIFYHLYYLLYSKETIPL